MLRPVLSRMSGLERQMHGTAVDVKSQSPNLSRERQYGQKFWNCAEASRSLQTTTALSPVSSLGESVCLQATQVPPLPPGSGGPAEALPVQPVVGSSEVGADLKTVLKFDGP